MQLLRQAKRNQPVSRNLVLCLYWALEIQLIGLFIAKKQSSLYGNLFKILDQKINFPLLTIVIFVSYIMQIIYLIVTEVKLRRSQKEKNKKQVSFAILKLIELKPFITIVIFSQINFKVLLNGTILIKSLAIANLVFLISQMVILKLVNVSYKFLENNMVRRKKNSIIPNMLVIGIVYLLNFYDSPQNATILLLVRASLMLYKNFNNVENQQIFNLQWTFPLISFQISFLVQLDQYFTLNIFNNFVLFSTAMIFTLYSANNFSSVIGLKILKRHLQFSLIGKIQQQERYKINGKQKNNIKQNQIQKLQLQLLILTKIYLLRINYENQTNLKLKLNQQVTSQNYNNWWSIINQIIVIHKTNCSDVQCKCNSLGHFTKGRYQIQNKIILNKIYSLIELLKFQTFDCNKYQIMQNYFLIQLENKPLKAYFQSVKLSKNQLSIEQKLQVNNLINQCQSSLTQLFTKQKVKNTEINVEPLFQFQGYLNIMRQQINDMAFQYQKFYQIFAENFVQMQNLKMQSKIITKFKQLFTNKIDSYLNSYNKSQELMAFSIIYFTFFDEYTNKLEKVQERALFLIQDFKKPFVESRKKNVDIFDPHYGAIKADLVFQLGKIVSITKNMCRLLGFPYRQLITQKVNKIMPAIFSRSHHKFLRNFVDKGQIKLLKLKQNQVYAKNSRKLIVPINLQLKVDYSSEEGMYGIAFTKLTETKSEYILMNNYGKIQEISAGIYDKFFSKAFGEEVTKIKRLCVGKFILSFNSVLRNIDQTHGLLQQGLILSSDSQKMIMNYFKFPQFSKIYKGKSENGGQSTSRSFQSNSSVQKSYYSSDGSRTVDLSDDLAEHSLDLKEAFRVYLKDFDFRKITAHRVYYHCENIVTSEFKCKIMQIVRIRQLFEEQILEEILKQQIIELSHSMGFQEQQMQDFKIFQNQANFQSIKSFVFKQKQETEKQQVNPFQDIDSLIQSKDQAEQNVSKAKKDNKNIDNDTDSVSSVKEEQKKKNQIINAFMQKPKISFNLQISLTFLFIALVFILIIVAVFSIQLKDSQKNIQEDNLFITNYRINFHILLGLQQINLVYKSYQIQPPSFLQKKRTYVLERMKSELIKMITWIDISQEGYTSLMPLVYENQNYQQKRTIMAGMIQFYNNFLYQKQNSQFVRNNYNVIYQNLLDLTTYEENLIRDYNDNYVNKVHIVIGCYSFVLLLIIAVKVWYAKIAYQKQDRVLQFLAFFKPKLAKKHAIFYEKFQEINKKSEQFDNQMIEEINRQIEQQRVRKCFETEFKNKQTKNQKTSGLFIKVVKNQGNGINLKIIIFCLLVLILCLFVIFYSEYFFDQVNTKFKTYLTLKNSAFLVQLIPYRILVLYFTDINRILQNKPIYDYPERYYKIAHDRIFQLPTNLAKPQYFGTQMEKIISQHFSKEICTLVECPKNSTSKDLLKDQQVYYLVNHFINAFSYMRKIIKMLPKMNNSKQEIKRWIDENNFLQVLETSDIILDLMKRSESTVTGLFSSQVNEIGSVLLALSLTLIPSLILTLLFFKKKFIEFLVEKLETTEQIFRNLSWQMIAENNYALNYFDDKIKNLKKK